MELFWRDGLAEYPLMGRTADWQSGIGFFQISPVAGAELWGRINRAAGSGTSRVIGSGIYTR